MTDKESTKKGWGNLQARIIALMTEKAEPTDLWLRDELMEELDDVDKRQAENALYNAWRAGKLFRHKDVNDDKQFQYALKIKESDKAVPPAPVASVSPGSSSTPKKRRGVMPTAKEIRMDFAEIQRLMARLEDKVMTVTEHSEEIEKGLLKLKNLNLL